MKNLWKETIGILISCNKTWKDVLKVCGYNLQITKNNFKEIAKQTNYDSGFGVAHIPVDLKIVGKDWWLERNEYDGSENWVYKEIPNKKLPLSKVTKLNGNHPYLKDFVYESNYLLIIDPQYDFIEGGALPVKGGKQALLNLVNLNENKVFKEVYATVDAHPENHCSFKEYGGIWPKHCVLNSAGYKIFDLLKKHNVIHTFSKGTEKNKDEYSIFSLNNKQGKRLNELLNYNKKFNDNFNLYIAGLAGDVCVKNTIEDLIKLGFKNDLIILENCIASLDGGKTLNKLIEKYHLKYE